MFRFGKQVDVRYLTTIPKIGDRVTHRHTLWVVSHVRLDAHGALVTCVFAESEAPARV